MSFIPAKLHQAKIFEERSVSSPDGDGQRLLSAGAAALEQQINDWVRAAGALLVGSGPLHYSAYEQDGVLTEIRSVVILYTPPVQVGDETYGGVIGGEGKPEIEAVSRLSGDAAAPGTKADREVRDGFYHL